MKVGWTQWLIVVIAFAVITPATAWAQDMYSMRDAVAAASSIVRPSVVAIETRFDEPLLNDRYAYWQYFKGARPLYGLWGSGFIYKDPDYVITSDFLMEHAEFIRVILDDGRSYSGELVGTNSAYNIAVVKVEWGPDLEPISPPMGDSDSLVLGQPIGIIGKALNSVDTYASAGIISAIRKEVPGADEPTDEFLQFDAVFELSYTGGPIVDVNGSIIGMIDRTVGMSDLSLARMNLGVPINEVIYAADKIIAGEDFEIWFGVERVKVTSGIQDQGFTPRYFDWDGDGEEEKVDYGMFVTYIEPNSPADIAGLQANDLIVEISSRELGNVFMKYDYDWRRMHRSFRIGELIIVKFVRMNEDTGAWDKLETQVQILEQPSEEEEE